MSRAGRELINHRTNKSGPVRSGAVALVALVLLGAWAASTARAADSIYWGNFTPDAIRVGGLSGSPAATNLFTGEDGPEGIAIDSAADRIYWADAQSGLIRVAGLSGSPAPSTLFSGQSQAAAIAIDPAANRIYWADSNSDTIVAAGLNGTPAPSDLFTGEDGAAGLAIDPAANKIYWTNIVTDEIRVGDIRGSSFGPAQSLFTAQNNPVSVAIDPAADRIYWASASDDAIRVGGLSGSPAPSNLYGPPTAADDPRGLAIDPAANRLYWANVGSSAVKVGSLDGTLAASNLFTAEPGPTYPALLRSPAGTGVPEVSGGGKAGQPLSCSPGSWAPNLLGAFLYREPSSFAYQWLLNGADVAGATGNTYTPTAGGSYACRVTAANHAGSASETSASIAVKASCKKLRKKLKRQKRNRAAAVHDSKRSQVQANIDKTKQRLRKRGC